MGFDGVPIREATGLVSLLFPLCWSFLVSEPPIGMRVRPVALRGCCWDLSEVDMTWWAWALFESEAIPGDLFVFDSMVRCMRSFKPVEPSTDFLSPLW